MRTFCCLHISAERSTRHDSAAARNATQERGSAYDSSVDLIPDRCRRAYEAFPDTESLSILLAAGVSRDQVVRSLDVDLGEVIEDGWSEDEDRTAWAVLEILGGVLAVELGGYGDPSRSMLRALSDMGRASAVARSNIQAHYRFGCARNGNLVFDENEYLYVESSEVVPDEVKPIFELARVSWNADGPLPADAEYPLLIGLAMAERFTGLSVEPAHVTNVYDSGFFAAPNLVYLDDLGG